MMTRIAEQPNLDPDLRFESQVLVDLSRYWQTVRADKPAPSRADIDPLGIPSALLPHILLVDVERQPETRFRWRLIGTHVTASLKRDSTGRYWDEIYDDHELDSLTFRATWVLRNRAPLRSIGRIATVKDRHGIVESLFAPLSGDSDAIDVILMGVDYKLPE